MKIIKNSKKYEQLLERLEGFFGGLNLAGKKTGFGSTIKLCIIFYKTQR